MESCVDRFMTYSELFLIGIIFEGAWQTSTIIECDLKVLNEE